MIDWMISIDADEIVYPFADISHGESLRDFFGRMRKVNAVRFLPVEACPQVHDTTDPVYDLRFFLNVLWSLIEK